MTASGVVTAPRILIVRLSAFGDLVHALPVVAAIRDARPGARIDWLVDARYAKLLAYASGLDRVVVVGGTYVAPDLPLDVARGRRDRQVRGSSRASSVAFGGPTGWWKVVRFLRAQRYDSALDLQGLVKSAVLARLSGARRVVGFAMEHLREPAARIFYSESVAPDRGAHVVRKNLAFVRALGITPGPLRFPLDAPLDDDIARALPADAGGVQPFAIVNPGAGWPNKRWSPERFGALAAHLRARHGLVSFVTWGPGEQALAEAVVRASGDAARFAPPTDLGDMIALIKRARLFVGGDTGPLQIAAAVGTPIVCVFGPTNPARNGPWSAADVSLSRFEQCECHHKRRCRRPSPCIDDITVDEVVDAADRRLASAG